MQPHWRFALPVLFWAEVYPDAVFEKELNMWQEIFVISIIAISAAYIGWRSWKKFKAGKNGRLDCAGGCESCKERAGCPFDQQSMIQPDRMDHVKTKK